MGTIAGRTEDPVPFQVDEERADERYQEDMGGAIIVEGEGSQAAQWVAK